MQSHNRTAIAIGLGSVAICVAFVAITERNRKAHPAGPLDAVPAGALLVGTADVAALRASPLGAPLFKQGREIAGLGKVRDVCGFDPLDGLAEVAIAIPAGGDTGEFGLVATGAIDDEAILGCASRLIEARGGKPIVAPLGGFRSVHDANQTAGSGEIAVRKGGPLLLGGGDYLRSMVDAAEGRAATVQTSVAHGFLGNEVGDSTARITVVLSPEQRKTLSQELAAGGQSGSPLGSIVAGGAGIKVGPTVSVHGVLSCENAGTCVDLANTLKAARDARAQDLTTKMVGLGSVFEKLDIQAKGPAVHVRIELPAEEATALVDKILTLRGMRHPTASPDETAMPRKPPPPVLDQKK